MTTDWKALCADLLRELDHASDWDYQQALKDQARAALAQPEPEGPTLAEIDDLCAEHSFHYEDGDSQKCLLLIITDALAHWGRPTPQPIPVSERLPGLIEQVLIKAECALSDIAEGEAEESEGDPLE